MSWTGKYVRIIPDGDRLDNRVCRVGRPAEDPEQWWVTIIDTGEFTRIKDCWFGELSPLEQLAEAAHDQT